MDLNDPKEFNDPQVIDNPKEISIGSKDFDNPKAIPPSSMVLLFSSLSRLRHDYVSVIIVVIVITPIKTLTLSGKAD